MITNRDLTTEDLFATAVEEAIESARENGVDDDAIADILRASAEEVSLVAAGARSDPSEMDGGGQGEPGTESGEGSETDEELFE